MRWRREKLPPGVHRDKATGTLYGSTKRRGGLYIIENGTARIIEEVPLTLHNLTAMRRSELER